MKSLLIACGLGLPLTASAQHADETPYQTLTFPSANLRHVHLRTSGGSLHVRGGSGTDARVEVFVRPNNWNGQPNALSRAEIEERLGEYDLRLERTGDTLVATARRKTSDDRTDWKRHLNIGFRVVVPAQIDTDLRTSGGTIDLENLSGKLQFTTSGGSLSCRGLSGTVRGRTSGGSIHLTDCRDDLDFSTSGGNIEAERSTGTLRLRTSGGSIELANVSGTVEASTSGGSIRADLPQLGPALTLRTSAGSIRVRMPLDQGLDLDVHASRIRFDGWSNFRGTMQVNRDEGHGNDFIRGTLNGGGIPVRITAGSGSVTLEKIAQ